MLLLPKYKKKVEYNWMGKQKLFDLKKNQFVDIVKPKEYSKYKVIDINQKNIWVEYWDKNNLTKKLAHGYIVE